MSTILPYFLKFCHGLQKNVSFYKTESNQDILFFYFRYNQKDYCIALFQDYIKIGIKKPTGGILNCSKYQYDENGIYIGESEYNINLDITSVSDDYNYIEFLKDLEYKTSHWETNSLL